MARLIVVAVMAVLAALLVSGCTGSSPYTPEERLERAMQGFAEGLGPDGSIRELDGEASVQGTQGSIEVEFGSNDVMKMTISAGPIGLVTYCAPDATVIEFGGEAYESRPDDETCEFEREDEQLLPFTDEENEYEVVEITEHDDGTLTAVVRLTEDGNETLMTLDVDADDRLTRMSMDDDEGEFTFDVEHGARRAISVPEAATRIPASITWHDDFDPGRYEATITGSDADLALAEFDVLVQTTEDRSTYTTVATFPLADPSRWEEDGFTFTYEDVDGDGLVSVDDTFAISAASWQQPWDHEVTMYDHWAEATLHENPIPSVSTLLVVVAALGLVGAASTLRRTR